MKNRVLIALVTVAVLLASGLSVVGDVQPQTAAAADGSQFDPGNIISDENFFNGNAMSSAEVQAFVSAQVGTCRSSYACLSTYVQSTPTMAAVSGRCASYAGSSRESAADIIAKVGQACGISQKAMLVLLQKEQGLVSSSNPSQRSFEAATGMGCPDTAPCDASFGGFFYQVYYAARQFKAYAASPNSWNHIAGRVNNIRYHPNADCGSSAVYISNQATAGLYNYTPYQPNGAALANLYGTGDGCSAYGNRNFWRIYTDWFGSPTSIPNPIGMVDGFVVVSQSSTGAQLRVGGWTFDQTRPASSIPAHVYITYPNGAVIGTPLTADSSRPDVGAAYPSAGSNHGYGMNINVNAGGTYKACVYGIGVTNNRLIDCKSLTIAQKTPTGSLDSVSVTGKGATTAISVSGWAFDGDLPTTPIATHIYVTSPSGAVSKTVVTASNSRPDLPGAFAGVGPNHGYQASIPVSDGGVYQVCAYAIGTYWTNTDVNPNLGCQSLNIVKAFPNGVYDSLTMTRTSTTSTLEVAGWTYDTGMPSTSIPVHFYVTDPSGATTKVIGAADKSRPDVNNVYGITGNHGFVQSIPVTTGGVYTVCAYGIAVSPLSAEMNPFFGCRSVTVVTQPPIGTLDTAVVATQPNGQKALTVTGWAIDRQVPQTTIPVHVYVYAPDGTFQLVGYAADKSRPDVGAAYPGTGTNHGYTATSILTQSGTYQVCTYGIGTANLNVGLNAQLGCKTFTN